MRREKTVARGIYVRTSWLLKRKCCAAGECFTVLLYLIWWCEQMMRLFFLSAHTNVQLRCCTRVPRFIVVGTLVNITLEHMSRRCGSLVIFFFMKAEEMLTSWWARRHSHKHVIIMQNNSNYLSPAICLFFVIHLRYYKFKYENDLCVWFICICTQGQKTKLICDPLHGLCFCLKFMGICASGSGINLLQ